MKLFIVHFSCPRHSTTNGLLDCNRGSDKNCRRRAKSFGPLTNGDLKGRVNSWVQSDSTGMNRSFVSKYNHDRSHNSRDSPEHGSRPGGAAGMGTIEEQNHGRQFGRPVSNIKQYMEMYATLIIHFSAIRLDTLVRALYRAEACRPRRVLDLLTVFKCSRRNGSAMDL